MRDIKNKLTSGKNTKNIKPRRGKMFGYQVLGFGAGGVAPLFITATGGTGGLRQFCYVTSWQYYTY